MNTNIKSGLATLVLTFSASAYAGPDCTSEPQGNWMSQGEMQKQIIDMGYTIDRFKVDDSCYEIYGRNGDQRKVEVYFNPVSGKVVKEEIED
ncbi:MAG: PepSY domain-containing protein [Woeseiaceae bacterium]|nr:PepSY domain-containing protein [Woeseiaceae bacterium]